MKPRVLHKCQFTKGNPTNIYVQALCGFIYHQYNTTVIVDRPEGVILCNYFITRTPNKRMYFSYKNKNEFVTCKRCLDMLNS